MLLINIFVVALIVQPALAQRPSTTTPVTQVSEANKEERVKWDEYTAVFRDMNSILTVLRPMVSEKNTEIHGLLNEIRSSNETLENEWQSESAKVWREIWGEIQNSGPIAADWGMRAAKSRWEAETSTPKAFLVSLKVNLSILENISKTAIEGEDVVSLLKIVSQDMKIKAVFCKENGWANLIDVTVVTKKGSKPEEGYEVWYVPRGWAGDASHWLAFPKLSTAFKQLPPGIYMMRVKGLEAVSIEIDGNGTTKQEVELKVP